MINYIKNWWNGEHCFAKNPFFWLLTAGACAAAPFTGFLSLAAIPAFAGLAQKGYLPHEKVSAGFKWLFSGDSVKKGQIIPQDDEQSDTQKDAEEHSLSFHSSHSHQSILEQMESAPHNMNLSTATVQNAQKEALILYKGESSSFDSLEEDDIHKTFLNLEELHISNEQSPNQRWIQLADEAVLLLEWLYRYRVQLNLNITEIEQISNILGKIPEEERPSRYSKEEQACFFILQKQGIFFDDEHFEERMALSGKKIATRLLLRFHEDKTRLPVHSAEIQPTPLQTSRNAIPSITLQSVCQMLNRLLGNIFIQKKRDATASLNEDISSRAQSQWQVSPQFWQKCDKVEAFFDREIAKTEEAIMTIQRERGATRERTRKKKQCTAENQELLEISKIENVALHQENLTAIKQKIEMDDAEFSVTCSLMTHQTSQGYAIDAQDINELIQSGKLLSQTVEKLIVAIIKHEKNLELPRRCLQTSENPHGFITQEKIELLVAQNKLPQKVLQKLGFAPLQQTSSSLFSFLPSFTKSHSGSSHSSKTSLPNEAVKGKDKKNVDTKSSSEASENISHLAAVSNK